MTTHREGNVSVYGRFCIVRSRDQGVVCGVVQAMSGRCVELTDARQIHNWSDTLNGRHIYTLFEMATFGAPVARISEPVPFLVMTDLRSDPVHRGSRSEPAAVAMGHCLRRFGVTGTEDETARLVAADWLDEQGHTVEAATLRESTDDFLLLFQVWKKGHGEGHGEGEGDGSGEGYGSGETQG